MHMHVLCFSVFLEEVIDLGLSGTVFHFAGHYLCLFVLGKCLLTKANDQKTQILCCLQVSKSSIWMKTVCGVRVGKLEKYKK